MSRVLWHIPCSFPATFPWECTVRNLITDYLGVHAQAMPLREQRMKLIASNLGNADTPGYKARTGLRRRPAPCPGAGCQWPDGHYP